MKKKGRMKIRGEEEARHERPDLLHLVTSLHLKRKRA